MSKQEFSQWFTNGEKPWEPGVYQQRSGFLRKVGYQRWDGRKWYGWHEDAEEARKCLWPVAPGFQNDPWRGLAHPPKAKP